MPFACPLCQNPISLKGAKPGRYKPKCPKCGGTFALTVPDDPSADPVAERLPTADELPPTVKLPPPPKPADPTAKAGPADTVKMPPKPKPPADA
jgi:eukaryotic-like serine/threonine-protein kinase